MSRNQSSSLFLKPQIIINRNINNIPLDNTINSGKKHKTIHTLTNTCGRPTCKPFLSNLFYPLQDSVFWKEWNFISWYLVSFFKSHRQAMEQKQMANRDKQGNLAEPAGYLRIKH